MQDRQLVPFAPRRSTTATGFDEFVKNAVLKHFETKTFFRVKAPRTYRDITIDAEGIPGIELVCHFQYDNNRLMGAEYCFAMNKGADAPNVLKELSDLVRNRGKGWSVASALVQAPDEGVHPSRAKYLQELPRTSDL